MALMWCMPSSFTAPTVYPQPASAYTAAGHGPPPCDDRSVQDGSLIPRFGRARRDPALAVLEGFHPLKHALRFGANVLEVVTRDAAELERLTAQLAPDLGERLTARAQQVEPSLFEQLAPLTPATGVIALAERRPGDPVA